jgi:hypothetical protein
VIAGAQIRAARGFLAWDRRGLWRLGPPLFIIRKAARGVHESARAAQPKVLFGERDIPRPIGYEGELPVHAGVPMV